MKSLELIYSVALGTFTACCVVFLFSLLTMKYWWWWFKLDELIFWLRQLNERHDFFRLRRDFSRDRWKVLMERLAKHREN